MDKITYHIRTSHGGDGRAKQASAISGSGSNAVEEVEPVVAHTMQGISPAATERTSSSGSSSSSTSPRTTTGLPSVSPDVETEPTSEGGEKRRHS